MKYKVIGWTYPDNYDIPSSNETIGFSERNAIIDEIRKNKYLFSGWHHQESFNLAVPILNDFKKREFSQRGWGGVMAEAYGEMNDYDYAKYTFYESLNHNMLCFPIKEFNTFNYKTISLRNEHFEVEINQELFNYAKNNNPFYLEDDEILRFIDENDTITIKSNSDSLTFKVSSIDRNKKEIGFKKSCLIKGKYKIILTYKPFEEKQVPRVPFLILSYEVDNIFKECLKNYNFLRLYELLNCYDINEITKGKKNKNIVNTLKQFVTDYIQYSFKEPLINKLLIYISDYDFFKQIAYQFIKTNPNIMTCFVTYFMGKGIIIEEDILNCAKLIKGKSFNSFDILIKAIEFKPNNKALRKKFYSSITHFQKDIGFLIMFGGGLEKYLRKEDLHMVDILKYKQMGYNSVLRFAEMITFNGDYEKYKKYPFREPEYVKHNSEIIINGITKYQNFVKSINVDYDIIEEILLHGIIKSLNDIDLYSDGYEDCAKYVYSLDLLTENKYNFKKQTINKYGHKYSKLKEYLEEVYK